LENAIVPENGKWVEPFMGSGVVGFNARPQNADFGDLNPHIINFYNAVRTSQITPKSVRGFLEREGGELRKKGEEYYYLVRERFNREKSPLDFLFLSRADFNGIIRFNSRGDFNVPFCKKPERFSKGYITKIVNQVQSVYELVCSRNWVFRHQDFRTAIANAGEDDFIYCDPPYYGRHTDYFNSWTEDDEYNLFVSLSTSRAKFALSTWYGSEFRQNPMVEKYWKEYYVLTKDYFYHVGAKESNRHPVVEALVLNYEPATLTVKRPTAEQLILIREKRKTYYSTSLPR
jgi:DNA adenine methylase